MSDWNEALKKEDEFARSVAEIGGMLSMEFMGISKEIAMSKIQFRQIEAYLAFINAFKASGRTPKPFL